ncbi:alpha-ketoacid dehydrogenase subunit beta [Thermococcus sp. 21S7]|uniref:alpha-ketoacid dehydrogenase subunit beta n=1 Tax=Thermococcus sp. 21S7 TaxID=1638221 RepID=UPI00143B4DCB|nr:alpha-ketoacid dehydrogenase subunit beta [Thermococcus sp. 21S7]NJE62181.1 alpha-ketoacid dehydrogenase subunit beta [Thermococcus sp. 21S7]
MARKLPMYKAIAEAIAQEMERDENVFVMGEDIGAYGGIFGATNGLLEKFGPERVRDTPISESAFIGAALGAASKGMRPIVELMFVDFFGVAMDQIYNHIAKAHYMSGEQVKMPIVITTAIGGGYSDAAQHSQCLYGLFAHVPGLKIVIPSNSYDAKGLMISSIRDDNPVMYFFHKGLMGLGWMPSPEEAAVEVPEEPYTVPIGEAKVVREGDDVTIATVSRMVYEALWAAEELEKDGISAEVIDLRTLVPLDKETLIDSVRKTGRLLVVDEDYMSYGMSGEIIATVVERIGSELKALPRRIAYPDVPVPYSRVLERFVLPDREKIVKTVKDMVG